MILLNVGSGGGRQVPAIYAEYKQHTLDIDPKVKPDVVCDALQITKKLKPATYDAVYCSHNLEHYYKHDVPKVLAGFLHVLKKDGHAHIAVPDLDALFKAVQGKDVTDTWYMAGQNRISFHDVLYGWGRVMAEGNLYYAHKCGFTQKSLGKTLKDAGFKKVMVAPDGAGNLYAFAFKSEPSKQRLRDLCL